jgi:endoglucanase
MPTIAMATEGDLQAVYTVDNRWSSGFTAGFEIENLISENVVGWTLEFDLPSEITKIWGATVSSHEGDHYVLVPVSWSEKVKPGIPENLGFVAKGDPENEPSNCVLDGWPCLVEPPTSDVSAETTSAVDLDEVYVGYGPSLTPDFNYGQATQMAWSFYDAQRSGPLPQFDGDLAFTDPSTGELLHDGYLANRLPWRGDTDLDDGADVGVDLTGGWHDAGDYVKFGLPMAFSATFLAWGVLEFEDALVETDQLIYAQDKLRWVADYLVRAHPEPNLFYGQVGEPEIDHSTWAAREVLDGERPSHAIDLDHPGPDLAAQSAAALAAASMVFADEPVYSQALLDHAVDLYSFAQATRSAEEDDETLGRYTDFLTAAADNYPSDSGAQDDLPFAAAWLYKATGDTTYLAQAESDYARVAGSSGHSGWIAVWDDVRTALYILMAGIAADEDYASDSLLDANDRIGGAFDYELHARNAIDHWLSDEDVLRTPGGFAWLDDFGSGRYASMAAFLALVHRNTLIDRGGYDNAAESYLGFATEQINYLLGDNPDGMSWVVGFGDSWSTVAHHRASHGSTVNDVYDPEIPRFTLYGAFAGGPGQNDEFVVDREDHTANEPACDINAGLTGALAGLVQAWGITGNEPDPDFLTEFPEIEEISAEIEREVASGESRVRITVTNETAYPPRVTDALTWRLFVDLSEVGGDPAAISFDVWYDEGAGVADFQRFESSAAVFYLEGSLAGVALAPSGESDRSARPSQSAWTSTACPMWSFPSSGIKRTSSPRPGSTSVSPTDADRFSLPCETAWQGRVHDLDGDGHR